MTVMLLRVLTGRRSRMTAAGPRPWVAAAALLVVVAAGVCALLGGGGVAPAAASVRAAAAARIHWGRAEVVPGLSVLNKGYNAGVNSLSCWAAGDCVAGGFYTDSRRHAQAFVAGERRGRWGGAMVVPGTAVLNKGGKAQVGSVSCARSGVCVAVGTYTDKAGNTQWFTAGERSGRWAKAAQVPDPALNEASISTVWCAPGGLCAAGGSFDNLSNSDGAWVMTETHGRWHLAAEVPGLSALAVPGGTDAVNAVWCSSAGNCGAGGIYFAGLPSASFPFNYSAFVVTETSGVWGNAQEVPGITALDPGMEAAVTVMSCPSAGNCTAAGYDYANQNICSYPCEGTFTMNEHDGIWETARGSSLADVGGLRCASEGYCVSAASALTCLRAGDCVLAGDYWPNGEETQAGVVSSTNGSWGKRASFTGAMSAAAVSCSSAGYCAAGGQTVAGSAFVASERRGTWGKAIVPGGIPARYNTAYEAGAAVNAVACPPGIDLCVAGGFYEGPKGGLRAFLVSQSR